MVVTTRSNNNNNTIQRMYFRYDFIEGHLPLSVSFHKFRANEADLHKIKIKYIRLLIEIMNI